MAHASDSYTIHECGGVVISGSDHVVCDRCAAYAYTRDTDGSPIADYAIGTGTDRTANRAAWDDGELASPDADADADVDADVDAPSAHEARAQ